MKSITVQKLKELMEQEKAILVDVRSPAEYKKCHLPNAINIDFYDEDFEENWNQLPQEKTFVIYCNHGEKSELALTFLASTCKTTVYHLEGGLKEWIECGGDLET